MVGNSQEKGWIGCQVDETVLLICGWIISLSCALACLPTCHWHKMVEIRHHYRYVAINVQILVLTSVESNSNFFLAWRAGRPSYNSAPPLPIAIH